MNAHKTLKCRGVKSGERKGNQCYRFAKSIYSVDLRKVYI